MAERPRKRARGLMAALGVEPLTAFSAADARAAVIAAVIANAWELRIELMTLVWMEISEAAKEGLRTIDYDGSDFTPDEFRAIVRNLTADEYEVSASGSSPRVVSIKW